VHPKVSSFPTGGTSFVVSRMCITMHQNVIYLCFIFSAITCPSGMVYQQCGPSCPQTCDTNEDTDCSGGCVEGCFCPIGQVLAYGHCIAIADCQGMQLCMKFVL